MRVTLSTSPVWHQRENQGGTSKRACIWAAYAGHLDTVRALIKRRPELDKAWASPRMFAALSGKTSDP